MSRLDMFQKNKAQSRAEQAKRRPWLPRLLRAVRNLVVVGAVLGVVAAAVGGWAYQKYVIREPGEHISREAILAVIAQESPVLYRDGQTRIGTFFDREHREYVPYAEIPRAWVDAIVAAEDQRFWEHPGVDPIGIARAMVQNVKAGKMVAGGSSLTQQTAKNIYYRPDRSLHSKGVELINALRLEAHHSKEEILEYYANQFHVSSNGRGIGIAARYLFDKEASELSKLECAYVAGMVKAPATYNPFIGATEERRAEARRRAKARTRYVLDRMLSMGTLSVAEHASLIEQDIPFRRGTFRYDSNVLIDEVAARLEQPPFPQVFRDLGIDNPSTAGISVVTTLDQGAQVEASWSLWHHLSDVGPLLEGQDLAALRLPEDAAPEPDPDHPPGRHEFRAGRVVSGSTTPKGSLLLDLGGTPCTVDSAALDRMAGILNRAGSKRGYKAADLVTGLPAGTLLWTSVREVAGEGGGAAERRCDLEVRPALQGAMMLLEQGQIRAMVGGNDNRNFNRAVTAQRQLGSTWKPILYAAALQLGWTPSDLLDNRHNVFQFEGTWYYPHPDHAPEDVVSLAWAGTRSENIASIWLLYHLIDRLDPAQLEDIAKRLGLAPRSGEEPGAWLVRARDEYGVISTRDRIPEIAWNAARADLLAELDQAGREREALELRSLFYGRGTVAEEARLRKRYGGTDLGHRLRALRSNWLGVNADAERCEPQVDALIALGASKSSGFGFFQRREEGGGTDPASYAELRVRAVAERLEVACGDPGEDWVPVDDVLISTLAQGAGPELASKEDVQVRGAVSLGTIVALRRSLERRALVFEDADPYSIDVLVYHPDFRALVSMRYMAALSAQMGIQEEIPPVLSLPLGAVDIRLEEVAVAYQTLLDGSRWSFPGERSMPGAVPGFRATDPVPSPGAITQLIAEIRDRDGHVIYRATPRPSPVMDPVSGQLVGDVLRNVVLWGTGQRARSAVKLGGLPVPVAGKTGTTNGYKNAAFCGFIPTLGPDGWRWGQGFTLAAYVGYDDNHPMTRGGQKLAGASGALPAWIGLAQGLADRGLLGEGTATSAEWATPEGFARVPVSGPGGLPATEVGEVQGSILVKVDSGWLSIGDAPERRVVPVEPISRLAARGGASDLAANPSGVDVGAVPGQAGTKGEYSEAELRQIWVEEMGGPPPAALFQDGAAPLPAPEGPDEGAAPLASPPDPVDAAPGAGTPDTGIVPRITPGEGPP
jgi:penicillin-binding protein 1A